MGLASVDVRVTETKTSAPAAASSARRSSHQSTASTVMTESEITSTTASVVTLSPPPSARTQQLMDDDDGNHDQEHAYGSSVPPSIESPWLRPSSTTSAQPSLSMSSKAVLDIAGSAPASSSIMMGQQRLEKIETPESEAEPDSPESTSNQSAPMATGTRREVAPRSRSNRSVRNTTAAAAPPNRGPLSTTSSVVDRRLIEKYERVNTEIEQVIRATNSDDYAENGQLLKQVRSELRKAKKNSSQIIHSQKELLEKMERQERGGIRRMFSMNREHKMEKLRHKLCEKLNQSVAAEEQLNRLERQSVSLTRMSFGSMCGMGTGMEFDELSELERERDDVLSNLISVSGMTDAQELHSRLSLFSSEKRACECAMKQVELVETFYRKALHLLRIALSTILGPTYTGGLKEFVLGPYPLAVEASQLIEQACRAIQPESRRRYKSYTPELSNVRPPKFPQPMIDFAKRGTRSNFDPSNAAAIEAMRKLRTSENVVILLQRIVIAKLELIEKWRRDVERDQENADDGYRKVDTRLQEHIARLARSVAAA